MIARLEGRLAEKSPEAVLLDVNGVGYEVRVPLSTFVDLPDDGKTVRLRIHTHVREDVLQLYGFTTEAERAAFRLLIGINGVGPRLALAILSGISVSRLAGAVRASDLGALQSTPGVGAKTAQRILVELRDRVDLLESAPEPGVDVDIDEATVSALVNLGYPRGHAEKVVRSARERLPPGPELEDLIREALRAAGS